MSCQICLEDFSDLLTNDPTILRVQQLCGAYTTCAIDVCSHCLRQHIQTTLYDGIHGVLPRVRCPICLVAINKSRWIQYATPHLVFEYEQLSASALTTMSPCCHDPNYVHYPLFDSLTKDTTMPVEFYIPTGWTDTPAAFQALMDGYLNHRMAASHVVTRLGNAQGIHNLQYTVEGLLEQIYDSERRAALYLSYLYRFPATTTVCCDRSFCFNCKGTNCGDTCEEEDGFDEASCMVRCRQCRAMLVVTDGCDSVHCPCGFALSWETEIKYRAWKKKNLVSFDLFDMQLVETWEAKRTMLDSYLETHLSALRVKTVERLISEHRSILQRALELWRRSRRRLVVNDEAASTRCGLEESGDRLPVDRREALLC